MRLPSVAALALALSLGQAAFAQTAPSAPLPPPPPPPNTQGAPAVPPDAQGAPPPAQWGSGITPQPSSTVAQPPPPAQSGAYPPGAYPPGAYPPGAYPPGAYPPGAYPPGAYPPVGSNDWGATTRPWPTATGPDGRPYVLPLEMKYDPDKGVPPGYVLKEQRRSAFMIAGAATTGGLWIVSCIAGGFMEQGSQWNNRHGWPMYIPVLGPFITIETMDADLAGATPLVFDGLAQLAGTVLFFTGLLNKEKVLKYQFQATNVELTPFAGPTEQGAFGGLTGTF